jgi:hypothetical protein
MSSDDGEAAAAGVRATDVDIAIGEVPPAPLADAKKSSLAAERTDSDIYSTKFSLLQKNNSIELINNKNAPRSFTVCNVISFLNPIKLVSNILRDFV